MALSAVAITDEMLATCKRLPIGYTKADSPTFVIDEKGIIEEVITDVKTKVHASQILK